MARARNIKPGLYKNENLAECSIWARFVFPGLWMLADRAGRMEDRPKRIKAELLPFDNADVDALLNELARNGFILRYEAAGERYIQVLKFAEHQTPHIREVASTIPAPTENSASTVPAPDKASPRSPDVLIPDVLIPDTEDKNVPEAVAPVARRKTDIPDDAVQVFEHWQSVTGHKLAKLDAGRVKAIKGRLKDGYTVSQICKAIDGNHADPWHRENLVDKLDYICKNIDKFIAIAERPPPNGRSANQNRTISNLQAYLETHEN